MVTRITAGFGFFSQVVLNDVTLVPCSSITVRLHGDSSVLSDMIVVWSFTPISEHSTDVHMDMTLCIKSALARSLARAAIDTMASITSKRFEERVEQLNGPASHARYTIAEESNQACDAKAPPLQQAPPRPCYLSFIRQKKNTTIFFVVLLGLSTLAMHSIPCPHGITIITCMSFSFFFPPSRFSSLARYTLFQVFFHSFSIPFFLFHLLNCFFSSSPPYFLRLLFVCVCVFSFSSRTSLFCVAFSFPSANSMLVLYLSYEKGKVVLTMAAVASSEAPVLFRRSLAFVESWLQELAARKLPKVVPAAAAAVAVAPNAAAAQPAKAPKPRGKQDAAPAAPEGTSMSKVQLLIGRVLEVQKHPESDHLFVEKIDLGEAQPRTIVSGLQGHVTIEEFTGRQVVVAANLEPRKMAGILSSGMVLVASAENKNVIKFLRIPEGTPNGERIVFPGHDGAPEPVLKKKLSKHWEDVAPDICTNEEGVAVYKGIPFKTTKGMITCELKNATIS